jgi:ABC-type antimicrobial peptide transport system permease subunit
VASVDREIAVNRPEFLEVTVDRQLARPRFLAGIFAAFGVFASMLGVIGLYAVIAYAVKQREHEIAIRMAVGAGANAIVNLFMREGIVVLLVGILAGCLGAIGIGRLLESQLFGVRGTDGVTLIASALALGLVSIAAIWWPARRATQTDPIIALKDE